MMQYVHGTRYRGIEMGSKHAVAFVRFIQSHPVSIHAWVKQWHGTVRLSYELEMYRVYFFYDTMVHGMTYGSIRMDVDMSGFQQFSPVSLT